MSNKTLSLPIYIKIIPLFFAMMGILCIILFREYVIVFLLNIVVFIPIFYFTLVKYIFSDNKIVVKYPYIVF
jgi:hypothetical protein